MASLARVDDIEGTPRQQHACRWPRWHHGHQERARHFHYQRQHIKDHLVRLEHANLLLKPLGAVSFKRGDRMRCVECGAEMGSASYCQRCGAPVPVHPQDEAPGTPAISNQPAKRSKLLARLGWTVFVLLNFVALWLAIAFIVIAITEGSPAQEGPDYIPLWACAFIALMFSIVPAGTVVALVNRRRRRRAITSDSPEPSLRRLP